MLPEIHIPAAKTMLIKRVLDVDRRIIRSLLSSGARKDAASKMSLKDFGSMQALGFRGICNTVVG
jgi:hypothetical protein